MEENDNIPCYKKTGSGDVKSDTTDSSSVTLLEIPSNQSQGSSVVPTDSLRNIRQVSVGTRMCMNAPTPQRGVGIAIPTPLSVVSSPQGDDSPSPMQGTSEEHTEATTSQAQAVAATTSDIATTSAADHMPKAKAPMQQFIPTGRAQIHNRLITPENVQISAVPCVPKAIPRVPLSASRPQKSCKKPASNMAMHTVLDTTLPLARSPPQMGLTGTKISPQRPPARGRNWQPPGGSVRPIGASREDEYKPPKGLFERIKLMEAEAKLREQKLMDEVSNSTDDRQSPEFIQPTANRFLKKNKALQAMMNMEERCGTPSERSLSPASVRMLMDNVFASPENFVPVRLDISCSRTIERVFTVPSSNSNSERVYSPSNLVPIYQSGSESFILSPNGKEIQMDSFFDSLNEPSMQIIDVEDEDSFEIVSMISTSNSFSFGTPRDLASSCGSPKKLVSQYMCPLRRRRSVHKLDDIPGEKAAPMIVSDATAEPEMDLPVTPEAMRPMKKPPVLYSDSVSDVSTIELVETTRTVLEIGEFSFDETPAAYIKPGETAEDNGRWAYKRRDLNKLSILGYASQSQDMPHSTVNVAPSQDMPHSTGTVAVGQDKPHSTGNVAISQDKPHSTGNVAVSQDKPHSTGNIAQSQDRLQSTGNVILNQDKPHSTVNVAPSQDRLHSTGNVILNQDKPHSTVNVAPSQDRLHSTGNVILNQDKPHSTVNVAPSQDKLHSTGNVVPSQDKPHSSGYHPQSHKEKLQGTGVASQGQILVKDVTNPSAEIQTAEAQEKEDKVIKFLERFCDRRQDVEVERLRLEAKHTNKVVQRVQNGVRRRILRLEDGEQEVQALRQYHLEVLNRMTVQSLKLITMHQELGQFEGCFDDRIQSLIHWDVFLYQRLIEQEAMICHQVNTLEAEIQSMRAMSGVAIMVRTKVLKPKPDILDVSKLGFDTKPQAQRTMREMIFPIHDFYENRNFDQPKNQKPKAKQMFPPMNISQQSQYYERNPILGRPHQDMAVPVYNEWKNHVQPKILKPKANPHVLPLIQSQLNNDSKKLKGKKANLDHETMEESKGKSDMQPKPGRSQGNPVVPSLQLPKYDDDDFSHIPRSKEELFISVVNESEREFRKKQPKVVRPECVPQLDLSLLNDVKPRTRKATKADFGISVCDKTERKSQRKPKSALKTDDADAKPKTKRRSESKEAVLVPEDSNKGSHRQQPKILKPKAKSHAQPTEVSSEPKEEELYPIKPQKSNRVCRKIPASVVKVEMPFHPEIDMTLPSRPREVPVPIICAQKEITPKETSTAAKSNAKLRSMMTGTAILPDFKNNKMPAYKKNVVELAPTFRKPGKMAAVHPKSLPEVDSARAKIYKRWD